MLLCVGASHQPQESALIDALLAHDARPARSPAVEKGETWCALCVCGGDFEDGVKTRERKSVSDTARTCPNIWSGSHACTWCASGSASTRRGPVTLGARAPAHTQARSQSPWPLFSLPSLPICPRHCQGSQRPTRRALVPSRLLTPPPQPRLSTPLTRGGMGREGV